MLLACRRANFRDVDSEVARALDVSSARPDAMGSARVNEVRVDEIGREK